jgi:hypothetical protein
MSARSPLAGASRSGRGAGAQNRPRSARHISRQSTPAPMSVSLRATTPPARSGVVVTGPRVPRICRAETLQSPRDVSRHRPGVCIRASECDTSAPRIGLSGVISFHVGAKPEQQCCGSLNPLLETRRFQMARIIAASRGRPDLLRAGTMGLKTWKGWTCPKLRFRLA